MKIEILCCHNCPFCNTDTEDGYSCNVGDVSLMTPFDSNEAPDKCPLRDEEIIVELKK